MKSLLSFNLDHLQQTLFEESADLGLHRQAEYLSLIFASFNFFILLYVVFGFVMSRVSRAYAALPSPKWTSSQRVDYLTRVVAIANAVMVTVVVSHASYYSCNTGQSIFADDACRLQPKNYHALSAHLTIGYLLFDFSATLLFNHTDTMLTY
jgi:hypothetical protein